MSYKNPQQRRTYQVGHLVVDLLFCIFCFIYLWKVQGSMMGMAQHILSGGVTVYYPPIGATILTILLFLLQKLLNRWFKLQPMWYALSFFPSFLLLSYVTSVNATLYEEFHNGHWCWSFPLLLGFFLGFVSLLQHVRPLNSITRSDQSVRIMVSNLFILLLMVCLTCALGYNQKELQHQNQLQTAILDGDYEKALAIGKAYEKPTQPTSALRAYVLAREGLLAEDLFSYSQPLGTEGLWIPLSDTVRMHFPLGLLYRQLGASPSEKTKTAYQFLHYLRLSKRQRTAVSDEYWLMAQLLERKLPVFVQELDSIHGLSDSLEYPRHYREALVLYKQRCDSTLAWSDSLLLKTYLTYDSIVKTAPNVRQACGLTSEHYRNTYWWYYDFQGLKKD